MLSRRSVRIKVMQLLYAKRCDDSVDYKTLSEEYWKMIGYSFDMFLFNLYIIIEIAKVAKEDEQRIKVKRLPTENDKVFTSKLFSNVLLQSLYNNKSLNKLFDEKDFRKKCDHDLITKIYFAFSKEEYYITYLANTSKTQNHLDTLLELYRFCRKSDLFNDIIGDEYYTWTDDKSLIIGSVKKVLKSLPVEGVKFLDAYYPDEETVKDYGETLLNRTFIADLTLLEEIKPVLQNWDHKRLAIIDMIILKMATCEMLEFPTIPTKVTLNEYVEVAKMYSTEKSKEFVNGVLDRLMKELLKDGKIKKEGRGLAE